MFSFTPAQKRMVIFIAPFLLNGDGNEFDHPYSDGKCLADLLKRALTTPTLANEILALSVLLATRPWGEDLRPHLQRIPLAAEWWESVCGMAPYLTEMGRELSLPLDEHVFQIQAARLLGAAMKATGQHHWLSCEGTVDLLHALEVYITL